LRINFEIASSPGVLKTDAALHNSSLANKPQQIR